MVDDSWSFVAPAARNSFSGHASRRTNVGDKAEARQSNNLPRSYDCRWTRSRKAEVGAAIIDGTLSLSDACARYRALPEEMRAWRAAIRRWGKRCPSSEYEAMASKGYLSRLNTMEWPRMLIAGDMVIDMQGGIVYGVRDVFLSEIRAQILSLLVAFKGQVVPRCMLMMHVYGEGVYRSDIRTLDVHVYHVRTIIECVARNVYVEEVWGRGYLLRLIPSRDKH